ncbi:MAG: response regulator transcription factor [Patescibacteria group bacterium]
MGKNNVKKILLVEDDKAIAKALGIKLSHFEVDLAHDGEEAIEAIAKKNYDLILLDIMMPKLDGFGVMEAMKKKKNTTPIFILTNLNQDDDVKRAKDLGAKDFLVKSNISLLEIVNKINNFF